MDAIANLLFVVAGSFLSGFAGLVLDKLSARRRHLLSGAGALGFLLVVAQVPFRGDAWGVLVSGGYAAIAGAHVTLQLAASRRELVARDVGTVAVWTTASVGVMAGLLWWVAVAG